MRNPNPRLKSGCLPIRLLLPDKTAIGPGLDKKRPLDLFSIEIGADEMGSLEKGRSGFIKWPPALIKW